MLGLGIMREIENLKHTTHISNVVHIRRLIFFSSHDRRVGSVKFFTDDILCHINPGIKPALSLEILEFVMWVEDYLDAKY